MLKRIKKSTRGLTFSLSNDEIAIGSKYRYVVDKANKAIIITPDHDGNMTVSRKKCGEKFKPLFDIRSKEVRELVEQADYLEVTFEGNKIVVSTFVKVKQAVTAVKSNIIRLEDVIGKKTGEIVLDIAVGCNITDKKLFGRPTLADDDYFAALLRQVPSSYTKHEELKRVYDVVSLFSGAGLLDYSFLDPRVRFVYGVDFDKDACETYENNIGKHIVCKDIRNVKASEVPNTDIIIGGPCCQGYSNCNRHNLESEISEEKRLLIDDYVRIVKEKQPDVFVIENVPRLLTKEDGLYIDRVINNLMEYTITTTVLVDCEVGGYSTRRRAIVIGSKIGSISLPSLKLQTPKTVRDALEKVDATWFNYDDVTKPSAETMEKMSYVPQGGNWKDIPKEICRLGPNTQSNIYRRLALDKPSPTLTNWRKSNITHPTENRILNVAEAAAIMGLPKEFKVYGASLDAKQQQIGNGVTQAMGRMIKNTILKALDAYYGVNKSFA